MNTSKSSSRTLLTILASLLVFTALILVGLNAFQLERRSGDSARINYVKGYLAARQVYKLSCPLPAQNTNQLFGHVKSVGPYSISVIQESLDTDPIVDGVSNTRVVNVTTTTTLERVSKKSPEQFAQEFEAFAKQKDSKTPPPSNVITQPIQFADLKAGDYVFVQSAHDLRLAETFDAARIRLLE